MENKKHLEFVEFAHKKYFEIKEKYGDDDWEQIYFDALADKYDTDSQQVISHLYYWDNDTIGEVAQGILEAIENKKLLEFDCFDDDYNSTTVVVGIVEK